MLREGSSLPAVNTIDLGKSRSSFDMALVLTWLEISCNRALLITKLRFCPDFVASTTKNLLVWLLPRSLALLWTKISPVLKLMSLTLSSVASPKRHPLATRNWAKSFVSLFGKCLTISLNSSGSNTESRSA